MSVLFRAVKADPTHNKVGIPRTLVGYEKL